MRNSIRCFVVLAICFLSAAAIAEPAGITPAMQKVAQSYADALRKHDAALLRRVTYFKSVACIEWASPIYFKQAVSPNYPMDISAKPTLTLSDLSVLGSPKGFAYPEPPQKVIEMKWQSGQQKLVMNVPIIQNKKGIYVDLGCPTADTIKERNERLSPENNKKPPEHLQSDKAPAQ